MRYLEIGDINTVIDTVSDMRLAAPRRLNKGPYCIDLSDRRYAPFRTRELPLKNTEPLGKLRESDQSPGSARRARAGPGGFDHIAKPQFSP